MKGVHVPFHVEFTFGYFRERNVVFLFPALFLLPPTISISLSTFFLHSYLRVSLSLFALPPSLWTCTDDVSFRILAFERVLGPVSVGVTIERAKDIAHVRSLARSFIRSSSTRSLVAARAFAKSVRVNGRSEIEATVPLRSVSLSVPRRSIPSGYSAVLYRGYTITDSRTSNTPVRYVISLPCARNFRTMH